MALTQYPLDKTFLVATWLEALMYGCFLCVFFFGVYVQVTSNKGRNTHNRVMFIISIAMFIIASLHVAMNCFRLLRGFSTFVNSPGGAVGYLGVLGYWDHIFKDTLYASSIVMPLKVFLEMHAAVYRCWILWNKDFRFIIFPTMLLIASTVSGYMVCGLYTTVDPNATRRTYSPPVSWRSGCGNQSKSQARYRTNKSNLMPVLRILVESAALYLFIEIILLSLYSVNYNAQYILLEIVTPTVGITFGMITIRITMRSHMKASRHAETADSQSDGRQTIGSLPMRRIAVNISKHTQDDIGDGKHAASIGDV
ncbi:hypothetical protein B0H11DRAFT_2234637 [Mycena galericulata]|nr:hypothetical protein B0H11DRAFT_2234637 [Mycena galericulata]